MPLIPITWTIESVDADVIVLAATPIEGALPDGARVKVRAMSKKREDERKDFVATGTACFLLPGATTRVEEKGTNGPNLHGKHVDASVWASSRIHEDGDAVYTMRWAYSFAQYELGMDVEQLTLQLLSGAVGFAYKSEHAHELWKAAQIKYEIKELEARQEWLNRQQEQYDEQAARLAAAEEGLIHV